MLGYQEQMGVQKSQDKNQKEVVTTTQALKGQRRGGNSAVEYSGTHKGVPDVLSGSVWEMLSREAPVLAGL